MRTTELDLLAAVAVAAEGEETVGRELCPPPPPKLKHSDAGGDATGL